MSKLYVSCPSYAITGPIEREERLAQGQTWADRFGWEMIASPLMSRFLGQGCWLPVDVRAEDMRQAMQYEVFWAARGGYGAIELVPALLELAPPARPPLLIGYSDITVLHACWAKRGWGATIYGSLADAPVHSRRGASLQAFVRGEGFAVSDATEPQAMVLRSGTVTAPLFAACLVVLANLCGTPAMPSLRGHMLAIEDIDEKPYGIDFALNQLYLSGALDGVVGLVGGSFHHEPHSDYRGPSVDDILARWGERLQVPTLSRLPFGHMDDSLTLLCGVPVTLAAENEHWSLTWAASRTLGE